MSAALLGGDVVGAVRALGVETLKLDEAQLKFLETSPEAVKQLKDIGFGAQVAEAGLAKLVQLAETPLILQLRGARAVATPGSTDDVGNLRAQIEQKTSAIEQEKKLRALGVSENDIVAAIIKLTNDRTALTVRLNALVDAENKARAEAAQKARDAARKPFLESVKGLGLKAEKAKLTSALNDDIAASELLIKTIQRQIEVEGRTFDLEEQLIQARLGRQALIQQKAAAAQAAEEEKAAKAEEEARKREEEVRKREARKDKLRQITRDRLDREHERAVNRRESRQKDLLEDLGLTREGDKPTPGSGSLLKRARSLQDQIKGTPLDSDKTRKQLGTIVAVLRKNFKTAGKDVRDAILGMLNDISSALEGGKKGGSGPLTKTTGLNTKKLIADLGLTPEQARALRGRLSGFNSGGRALAGGQSRTTGGGFSGVPVVESRITVNLDGVKVASAVTRSQQRTRRRNPQQKRGQHRR
jgi:hypothetical protein